MRIIATIGPSSTNKKILQGIIEQGVTTIRLNFSHFYYDEFVKAVREIREIDKSIEIMGDLCGKKIRVYENIKNTYRVYSGEIVYFCGEDLYEILIENKDEKMKLIPLSLSSKLIEENTIREISMKDGTMNFEILDKDKVVIKAKALTDGIVRGGKGCNIPNIHRGNMSLSIKDKENIKWAYENNLDIISQSYVESKSEIDEIKRYIRKLGGDSSKVTILSKVETLDGLNNYKEILANSDGIIIARGDLVPECGLINCVQEQFKLLSQLKEDKTDKEIIIATHLLDNMKSGYGATLPEVESIYRFIKCGVTGFLLASETSVGKTPVNTVSFLRKLINQYK